MFESTNNGLRAVVIGRGEGDGGGRGQPRVGQHFPHARARLRVGARHAGEEVSAATVGLFRGGGARRQAGEQLGGCV